MMAENDQRGGLTVKGPSLGIAFGCGGARGIAHIHVIEALDELGIRPTVIAGSSIGAIMGAAMASGMSGSYIRDHTLLAVGSQKELLSRFWRSRPPSMKEMLTGGFRIGQFNLERLLRSFLPQQVPEHFSDLVIPLKTVATDFYTGEEVVQQEGRIVEALAASAAIPAVFRPVKKDGKVLVDGGMRNPVPYDLLTASADIVVAIDVGGMPEGDSSSIPTSVDAIYGASQLLHRSLVASKMLVCQPDVLLRPRLGKYRTLDFMKAREILDASKALKDETKFAVERALQKSRDDRFAAGRHPDIGPLPLSLPRTNLEALES